MKTVLPLLLILCASCGRVEEGVTKTGVKEGPLIQDEVKSHQITVPERLKINIEQFSNVVFLVASEDHMTDSCHFVLAESLKLQKNACFSIIIRKFLRIK